MTRLRIAGIGASYFSLFHLEGWRSVPEAEVVAWCDAQPGKAEGATRDFGVIGTYTDATTMLDAVKPELVDIVTPPESHAALVALARARGIPVICQKPLTPSWDESVALIEAAERAGVALIVHENFRVMTANLAIALHTPPAGGTLFVAAKLANAGIGAITRALIPLMAASVTVLFLVTYWPGLTRWLPALLY